MAASLFVATLLAPCLSGLALSLILKQPPTSLSSPSIGGVGVGLHLKLQDLTLST